MSDLQALQNRMMKHLPALTNALLGENEPYPNGLSMNELHEDEDGMLEWEVWDEYNNIGTQEVSFYEEKELVLDTLEKIEAECNP